MLDKVSKIKYSDSVLYSDSQDFDWKNIEDYTSSSYGGKENRLQILMAKYKTYLYIQSYTRHCSDESESSYIDPDMDIVFRYMRSLPKRIRKIVNTKIVCPDISSTDLAKRLKINRDTLYADYMWMRKRCPDLLFFTCPAYRNER